jgi:hypothetical protein
MRRARFLLTMAVLSVGLFVMANPVFAATSSNGSTVVKVGPGKPVLPEAPLAIILPLVGLVCFAMYRRRQHTPDTTAQ